MKILVCGSRNFPENKKDYLFDLLDDLTGMGEIDCYYAPKEGEVEIIAGGAKGPDTWAEEWAKGGNSLTHCWPQQFREFPADWDKHGKKAGFLRNQEMINQNPDYVVACWDGESNGTKNTINLAKKKGITTVIIYP